jgi:hypothetical protein
MEALMQVKRADNISGIRDPGSDRPSVDRQVMTLKFLLWFKRLKPSLPESPGGPREAVPAGHG